MTFIFASPIYLRYPNRRNVVNCRNDQLFVAAGVKKRAFGWFNKLGVTNCYRTAVDVNGGMAKDFDKVVLAWKKAQEDEYKGMKAEGLDPKNKDHVKEYRKTHPTPPGYLVSLATSTVLLFSKIFLS